ncbi:MAG: acetamidase/formamidase family protein [Actinomycetota bacterium]|nr:acetamidase/formamidase family protein [Actinomycetota bacterium]
MLRFEPDADRDPTQLTYTFGGVEALATVQPGTVLSTWTMDCFAGRVRSTSDLVSQVCDLRFINPQTGPFHVVGAEPGDTLAVHFRSITPRESRGVSTTVPLFGSLTATHLTAMLHDPLPERTWVYEIDNAAGVVRYDALDSPYQVDLPLDPMHGTVGVAPPLGEVRSSLTPGDWGGNMDTPEMRAGTTCYLGVNVEGALLSLGDGHARQGEGEACGVAVECAMDTLLVIDLIKGAPPPAWPRLEDDEFVMTTGSARPLEDACRIALSELVGWVRELTGLSAMDSYQLVSQTALTPIANVVDTNYTVVAKLAKRYLLGATVMGGLHDRLRATD